MCVSEMRDRALLPETDPSLFSPTLEVCVYGNFESSLPLESDARVRNIHLTGREEVIDLPLISIAFVISSLFSTCKDTTIDDLALLTSPLPLGSV